ncbi:OTU-domain-containing protein [Trichodelitschia bisporula]|uniref:OTU-domain-containing protein n=1 Tax=Trichodelitschia bisporula TaxID=703511 RepID=A0A6G1HUD2_9PEZI|nr:OTU-domain-containing protein [Trichodelitschia bisporula]
MDALLARHRKETRDLQSRITQKKKAATKKTRKGVNDECAALEAELSERHAAEIAELTADTADPADTPDDLLTANEQPNTPTASNPADTPTPQPVATPARKPNRQKARLARRAAEAEEAAAQARAEAASLPDLRARERAALQDAFKARGLVEREVRADGHCLYAAVADQLPLVGLKPRIEATVGYRLVRRTAAEYIARHGGEFEGFLEEPLTEYVRKVGETGEWGGQLELLALAKAYGVDICVLDGDGSVHEIEGPEKGAEGKKIWLAYYRHGFGLGEHYNSLRKA